MLSDMHIATTASRHHSLTCSFPLLRLCTSTSPSLVLLLGSCGSDRSVEFPWVLQSKLFASLFPQSHKTMLHEGQADGSHLGKGT